MRASRLPRALPAVILCVIFLIVPALARAETPSPLYTPRERFGVCVAASFSGDPDFPSTLADFPGAEELGFGWYSDWRMREAPQRPNGIEYAQMLPTRNWPPNWERVERIARANRGSLWMVGNEPETRGQGGHTPEEYAEIYAEAYAVLKGLDPTARVAIGGVVMPSPLRLEWLERCLDHYEALYGKPMPVDVWNIHMQILQEKRADWGCGIPRGLTQHQGRLYEIRENASLPIFRTLIYEFREWLHQRGEGHKELIISEYGVLMPSSYLTDGDRDVLDFMSGTFDFMLTARDPVIGCPADGGRLVQRWMWYSLNFPFYDETPGGFNGALYRWDDPEQMTVFGELFHDYASSLEQGRVTLGASADTQSDLLHPTYMGGRLGRLTVRGRGPASSALVRFDLSDLPQDAVVTSAYLSLQVVAASNPHPLLVGVRPEEAPWDEALPSLSLQRASPAGALIAELVLSPGAELSCDVTAQVSAWVQNPAENHGLRISTEGMRPSGNATYSLASREWIEGPEPGPLLWVEYLTRGEVAAQAAAAARPPRR